MSLVLGVDSGGTKTVFALADRDGDVKLLRLGPGLDPSAGADWEGGLESLLEQDAQGVEAAVLGLPFHDEVERYSQAQSSVAARLIPGNTLVQNDVRIAFDGALAGQPGVLVLAGTGSMAWASLNGPSDPHFRVGGWGDAFGDEGSAFWIGLQALSVVSRHLDRRNGAPEFSAGILAALNLLPGELIGWCYQLDNRRMAFAAIARTVSRLAEAGNADAKAILDAAADHLAAHITSAWAQTEAKMPLCWSYAGGVFASAIVKHRIVERVRVEPVAPCLPPIGGALLRAAANAGWAVDDGWINRLSGSLDTMLSAANHRK
jgi:N-acetylglucosamine kinase